MDLELVFSPSRSFQLIVSKAEYDNVDSSVFYLFMIPFFYWNQLSSSFRSGQLLHDHASYLGQKNILIIEVGCQPNFCRNIFNSVCNARHILYISWY
jgi:hypothetical protein